ncbi:alpha/beta fold hydrolase [Kribbella albertanoniae]|uniref:Alpha/beta hydrolase n=1 Tax=Kribbella albertanoniae TaxID=1266829 RepID=A0A4R4Q8I0_9ACTN|nr:alpha/beta hydrolase [Kribbella albertanoniae]TDC31243.1 alpha/beta hydrolase [Kribbella albertanoniae]
MQFSTSDNVPLWTATTGTATSAAAPVIILHGGPGTWDDHARLAQMIDDLTVVHRFDQRGCGRSGASDELSMARSAQDIDELREYWGHEKIVVIGHSFGATLAITYAAAYPDRVAGVVYLDGVGIGDWRAGDRVVRESRMTPEQAARLDDLGGRPRTREEEIEFRVLAWFPDFADPERAMEWALEDASVDLPISWTVNRALSNEINSWPDSRKSDDVAAIPAPITFIHGEGDPRPHSAVQALAEHAQQPSFHLIPDAGHSPWREQPEAVREILRSVVLKTP